MQNFSKKPLRDNKRNYEQKGGKDIKDSVEKNVAGQEINNRCECDKNKIGYMDTYRFFGGFPANGTTLFYESIRQAENDNQ